MLVGSMMMPEPIMLTITNVVSPTRLIFLLESAIENSFLHTTQCPEVWRLCQAVGCRYATLLNPLNLWSHYMNISHAKHVRREFYKAVWFYFRVVWPIFSILLTMIIVLGLVISHLEGWGAFDGIYFAFVTGLTIGYGDLAPKLASSRVLAIVLGFHGVLMTAIFAAVSIRAIEATAEAAQSEPQSRE